MSQMNPSGWRKDPHISNETYHLMRAMKLPPSANNGDLLPLVGNQDGIGACVGFGISELCHTEGVKDGVIGKKSALAFSPWWIYNGARFYEGKLNLDWGCYPSDGFRWLEEHGFLDWALWPFTLKSGRCELDTSDPNAKDSLAVHYPKFKKMRIDNGNQGIMDALSQRYCVAIGTPWPQSWSAGDLAVQPKVAASSKMGGGHEYLLYAYTDDGLYEAQNSWDDRWGQYIPFLNTHGGFKFRAEDLDMFRENLGGYDAFRIDVDMSPVIPPEPVDPVDPIDPPVPPKPKTCCQVMSEVIKIWNSR